MRTSADVASWVRARFAMDGHDSIDNDQSQKHILLPVKSKFELLAVASYAEECFNRGNYLSSCRYFENLRELFHAKPKISDLNWNSREIEEIEEQCLKRLAIIYYKIEAYGMAAPLIERHLWLHKENTNQFIEDSQKLIFCYLKLEEFEKANVIALLLWPILEKKGFGKDDVDILTLLTDVFRKDVHYSEMITTAANQMIALSRDANSKVVIGRIRAFLSKAEASVAVGNFTTAEVFAGQALALATSSVIEDDDITISTLKAVEILTIISKKEEILSTLWKIEGILRAAKRTDNVYKTFLGRLKLLIGLYLHKHGFPENKESCRNNLEMAANILSNFKSQEDAHYFLECWDILLQLYQNSPDLVQMEFGRKAGQQLLSGSIYTLISLVEKYDSVPSSLISIINKATQLFLQLEYRLGDGKQAVDIVEWARASSVLSKIPCRRLLQKLEKAITLERIEKAVSNYNDNTLVIYFASTGKGSAKALHAWCFIPNEDCSFHTLVSANSSGNENSLDELTNYILSGKSLDRYDTERRLLSNFKRLPPTAKSTAFVESEAEALRKISSLTFSKLPIDLWAKSENIIVIPDGPLLALTCYLDDLVNLCVQSLNLGRQVPAKKVWSLPCLLFLEICWENKLASAKLDEEYYLKLQQSQLAGLDTFFQNERTKVGFTETEKPSKSEVKKKRLLRPESSKLAQGAHTISTLTTASASGADICTSSLYSLASTNDYYMTTIAAFFANPIFPEKITFNEIEWRPPVLAASQREVLELSKVTNSSKLFLAENCSKAQFLQVCSNSVLLHFSTFVSHLDGVVTFSFQSPDKEIKAKSNIFSPKEISGFKLIPAEIACLPLRAKVVSISAVQSPRRLLHSIEHSTCSVADSSLILPAAFLLAGAHAVITPKIGLSNENVVDGFKELYSRQLINEKSTGNNSEANFGSVVGVYSSLDLHQLAHAMLDQDIQKAKTSVEQQKNLKPTVFIGEDSRSKQQIEIEWFARVKHFIYTLTTSRPSFEDFLKFKLIVDNYQSAAEEDVNVVPGNVDIQQFLIWLGFHVSVIDETAKLLMPPIRKSDLTLSKVAVLIETLPDLYSDPILCDAVVDVLETLTLQEASDFVHLFSVIKHTAFNVDITDEIPSRLFQNPKFRSFLHIIGFVVSSNSVIFRFSIENTKRLVAVFNVLISILFSLSIDASSRFIPETSTTEPENAEKFVELESLKYVKLKGPKLADQNPNEKRIIATEPIFHKGKSDISIKENSTKIELAKEVNEINKSASDQAKMAKKTLQQKSKIFTDFSSQINDRRIDTLPNRITSYRVKVEPGGTPSQSRQVIGHRPAIDTSVINKERGKIDSLFNEAAMLKIAQNRRRNIEEVIAKYTAASEDATK